MASNAPQISLAEKLDVIPANLAMIGSALYHAITGPFRGSEGATYYQSHATRALVRKMCNRMSIAQLQYSNPGFVDAYKSFCKSKSITPTIVPLAKGGEGFWLGKPDAKNVLVYIHGGGFVIPGSIFHLMLYQTVLDSLKQAGKEDVGIFFVAYTLAPHDVFPTQFEQSVDGLRHILSKHSPSDVILSGDSAGGNLALAVMSHILHPYRGIPELNLSEPLKGLMVMAPWVSFRTDWTSNKSNEWKDCITAKGLELWASAYKKDMPTPLPDTDNYIEAVKAPASWWEGAKVNDTLVLAGGEEILRDPVLEWAEKFKSVNPNTTVVVGKTEAHDEPIYAPMQFDSSEKETGKALKEWLKARI